MTTRIKNVFTVPQSAEKYLVLFVLVALLPTPRSLLAAEAPPPLVYVSTALAAGWGPDLASIAVDNSGNSYVAFSDWYGVLYVGKISYQGALIWGATQTGFYTINVRIKIDAEGNAYVAASNLSGSNGFLLKYNTNGLLVKNQIVPFMGSYGEMVDIAYDPLLAHIYTAVTLYGMEGSSVLVLAYNSRACHQPDNRL